ncbi:MAG: hypothetical protein NUV57_00345 [archaeon]|nr:hypothetical protein [archaeon]
MNKKLMTLIGLLAAGFILIGSVSAFHTFGGINESENNSMRSQMNDAVENNDYSAFIAAHEEMQQRMGTVSEEQFASMVEKRAFHDKVQQAVMDGNFDEWKQLLSENNTGKPDNFSETIPAENFYLLKDLHDAREAGDFETAMKIKNELGMEGQGFGKRPFSGCHGIRGF